MVSSCNWSKLLALPTAAVKASSFRVGADGSLLIQAKGVAVTVMTNYGFHTAMAAAGIEVATTAVGDRYVLEQMLAHDLNLGGEQSGHVILRDHNPTGDGLVPDDRDDDARAV